MDDLRSLIYGSGAAASTSASASPSAAPATRNNNNNNIEHQNNHKTATAAATGTASRKRKTRSSSRGGEAQEQLPAGATANRKRRRHQNDLAEEEPDLVSSQDLLYQQQQRQDPAEDDTEDNCNDEDLFTTQEPSMATTTSPGRRPVVVGNVSFSTLYQRQEESQFHNNNNKVDKSNRKRVSFLESNDDDNKNNHNDSLPPLQPLSAQSSSPSRSVPTGSHRKTESARTRQRLVQNWKFRKVDLRKEPDWGQAIDTAVRHFQLHHMAPPPPPPAQTKQPPTLRAHQPSDEKDDQVHDHDDSNDNDKATIGIVDSSDDEQEAILNRLLVVGSQQQQEQQQRSLGAADSVDFWERGLIRPKQMNHILEHYHAKLYQSISTVQQQQQGTVRSFNATSSFGEDEEKMDTGLTTAVLKELPPERLEYQEQYAIHQEGRYEYLPVSIHGHMTTITDSLSSMVPESWRHQRQFVRAAARHFMATTTCDTIIMEGKRGNYLQPPQPGPQISSPDRILRVWWNCDLWPAHWKNMVLYQARLAGQRFLEYSNYMRMGGMQLQPACLVDELGLSPSRQLYGPLTSTGTSLAPKAVPRTERKLNMATLFQCNSTDDNQITFTALPGTIPPTPSFPLEATSIMFGPMDRNAYMDHSSVVDDALRNWTLSLWLGRSRMLAPPDCHVWDEAIQTLVRELVHLTSRKFHAVARQQPEQEPATTNPDSPLVALNHSLVFFASVMANLYIRRRSQSNDDDNDMDNNQDDSMEFHQFAQPRDDDDENNSHSPKLACQSIFEMLGSYIDRTYVRPFPRLRILFGLAQLSQALPESGVELLSRPFDSSHCRTPFDLFQTVLNHLEHRGYLDENNQNNDTSDNNVMSVPVLEYAFHQAASSFSLAVEADPTEPFYHAWHIAAMACCLLLCSGNRIDGEARGFPSRRQLNEFEQDEEQELVLLPHEVRVKLSNFKDLRQQIAMAVDILLDLGKHQKSCRAYLSIASLLEWRQVIALLFGDLLLTSPSPAASMQKLHASYSFQWACLDQSSTAMEYWNRLASSEDDRLNALAAALENNPDNIAEWRRLVEQLGPLPMQKDGSASSSSQMYPQQRRNWMKERARFWVENLLSSRLPNPASLTTTDVDEYLAWQQATSILEREQEREEATGTWPQQSVNGSFFVESASIVDECREWLRLLIVENETGRRDTFKVSEENHRRAFDRDFPRNLASVLDDEPIDATLLNAGSLLEVDDVGEDLEVLSYKALILGHIMMITATAQRREEHDAFASIQRILKHLYMMCWDATSRTIEEDCLEWRCLVWLYCKGLHIVAPPIPSSLVAVAAAALTGLTTATAQEAAIVDSHSPSQLAVSTSTTTTTPAKPKTPKAIVDPQSLSQLAVTTRRATTITTTDKPINPNGRGTLDLYPKEIQEAVIEGMERFGFGKWSQIHKSYPDVFKGHHRRKAEYCYHQMVRMKSIQPHPDDVKQSWQRHRQSRNRGRARTKVE
ncbi:hypothetical protein ACA910_012578 [Epithemia clementina (nom. ined.)]